jgi:TonB family protein
MATVFRDPKGLAHRLVIRLCILMSERDKLNEIAFSTAIAFMFLGAGFCVIQQMEKMHPRVVRDHDICFELNVPTVNRRKDAASSQQRTVSRPKDKPPTSDLNRISKPVVSQLSQPVRTKKTPQRAFATPATVINSADAVNAAPLPIQYDPSAANASVPDMKSVSDGVNSPGLGNGTDGPIPSKPEADLNAVAGANFGAQKPIALAVSTPRMGNISPYRQDLLSRLAKNWKPHRGFDRITIKLTIAKDGSLIDSEIVQSSGSIKVDRAALTAVECTEFAPLPDWYSGPDLSFQLNLSAVVHSAK